MVKFLPLIDIHQFFNSYLDLLENEIKAITLGKSIIEKFYSQIEILSLLGEKATNIFFDEHKEVNYKAVQIKFGTEKETFIENKFGEFYHENINNIKVYYSDDWKVKREQDDNFWPIFQNGSKQYSIYLLEFMKIDCLSIKTHDVINQIEKLDLTEIKKSYPTFIWRRKKDNKGFSSKTFTTPIDGLLQSQDYNLNPIMWQFLSDVVAELNKSPNTINADNLAIGNLFLSNSRQNEVTLSFNVDSEYLLITYESKTKKILTIPNALSNCLSRMCFNHGVFKPGNKNKSKEKNIRNNDFKKVIKKNGFGIINWNFITHSDNVQIKKTSNNFSKLDKSALMNAGGRTRKISNHKSEDILDTLSTDSLEDWDNE